VPPAAAALVRFRFAAQIYARALRLQRIAPPCALCLRLATLGQTLRDCPLFASRRSQSLTGQGLYRCVPMLTPQAPVPAGRPLQSPPCHSVLQLRPAAGPSSADSGPESSLPLWAAANAAQKRSAAAFGLGPAVSPACRAVRPAHPLSYFGDGPSAAWLLSAMQNRSCSDLLLSLLCAIILYRSRS